MAVGLLNYDAPSSGLLTEQLSWNMVFGVGALLQRSSGRSKARNPTIIVTFFLAALEARLQRSAIVGAATAAHDLLPASAKYGGRSEPAHSVVAADLDGEGEEDVHDDSVVATVYDISGDDGGVYAACNEVRRAVLVGDVPQWKRRTALIITARSKAPARLDLRTHKPAFAIESVIVMDVDSMDKAYGNTIATFV
eukprot:contig_16295_g3945